MAHIFLLFIYFKSIFFCLIINKLLKQLLNIQVNIIYNRILRNRGLT